MSRRTNSAKTRAPPASTPSYFSHSNYTFKLLCENTGTLEPGPLFFVWIVHSNCYLRGSGHHVPTAYWGIEPCCPKVLLLLNLMRAPHCALSTWFTHQTTSSMQYLFPFSAVVVPSGLTQLNHHIWRESNDYLNFRCSIYLDSHSCAPPSSVGNSRSVFHSFGWILHTSRSSAPLSSARNWAHCPSLWERAPASNLHSIQYVFRNTIIYISMLLQ